MLQRRQTISKTCWLLAGLPIIGAFIQALVALTGTAADTLPVIGVLKASLQSIAVFDAAGVVFESSSTIVFLLFVLITLAWVTQAVSTYVLRNRELSLGAAGFVSLFLVLFVLVYLPLFEQDIPVIQTSGFLLIPLVAAVASWAAVLSYAWDVTLDDEARELLSEARATVRSARTEFDERAEREASEKTRERLRTLTSEGVDQFEANVETFHEESDELLAEIERLTDDSGEMSSRERRERATQLVETAAELDPDRRIEHALSELRSAVIDGIHAEFGDLHCVSRYGQAYAVRNLRAYNELALPGIDGPPVQVGGNEHELADRLAAAVEDHSLEDVARAVTASRDHIDELERRIDSAEADVSSTLDELERELDLVDEQVAAVDGSAGERLRELLVEGRLSDDEHSVPTVPSVEATARSAKDELHDGNFERALQHARSALDAARELQGITEFFAESLVATIEYGSGSVPVPSSVDDDLVERMRLPFEETYEIDYALRDGTVHVDRSAVSGDDEDVRNGASAATDVADDAPPADDVLYVLRELKAGSATTRGTNVVELQTESLPEKFASTAILGQIKSFGERQDDVVSVSVPEEPPGYVAIEVASGVSPRQVMDGLQDRYTRTIDSR